MKGFTHFVSALAAATCFPEVVRAAAEGAVWPALAGIAAMLPDVLDFRLARWLEQPDRAFDTDRDPPDPAAIAQAVVEAIAAARESPRPVRLMLHTLRLGPDAWRCYSLRFDPPGGTLTVTVGPVVTTGGRPYPGTLPEGGPARVSLPAPIRYDYDLEITVDIFSGPSLAFEREGGAVRITFLPWHRAWSHSLLLAAGMGLGVGGIWGFWPGLMVGLGYTLHILEDQLGRMGCNLFWPLTRRRIRGLGWFHSGDPWPNFMVVWTSVVLLLWNLDRHAAAPRLSGGLILALLAVPLLLRLSARHPSLRLPEELEESEES